MAYRGTVHTGPIPKALNVFKDGGWEELNSTCMHTQSLSHVWLCYPTDCSLSGSSVHGILLARILEWVTISFSRGSSRPKDQTRHLLHCQADSVPLRHLGILLNSTEDLKELGSYTSTMQTPWDINYVFSCSRVACGSLSTTGLYNKPISGINIKSVSIITKNEVNMIR